MKITTKCLAAIGLLLGFEAMANQALGESKQLDSKVLQEQRSINVKLPKSYFTDSKKRYPVIYRLDGKANIPYLSSVIERLHNGDIQSAPEVIIVAIENTDRMRDLFPSKNEEPAGPVGHGGGAPKFLQFIETELVPFVNKTYRTHDFKVIAGASAGGVFALYALQAKPGLFQGHIAYSPAVWWNYGASAKALKSMFKHSKELDNYVYINIGEEGGVMRERYDDMIDSLNANKPKGLRLVTENYDGVSHGLTSGAGAFNAYQKLFLRRQMPLSSYTGSTDSITEYYQNLSTQHGEVIKPQEALLRQFAYHYLGRQQFEQAITLFKYNVAHYPNSAEAHNGLAYGYEESGNYPASLQSVEKALSLATSESPGYHYFVERKQRLTELLSK